MTHAILALLCLPALGQETGVLGLATCEQLAPRELRFTVTLRNYGQTLNNDLTAFIHFDRRESGEHLYAQVAPGLRPLVAPTQSSTWAANEALTLTFAPVTVPNSARRAVFVKLGLYDPDGGVGRFSLVGADATGRVLIGSIDCAEDACRWTGRPPTPSGDHAEKIGVRPRGLVRSMTDPPAVRFGEENLSLWTIEPIDGGDAGLARTREDLCWSESSVAVTYTGEGLGSGFVLRPPDPLPVAAEADVARIWIMGRWRRATILATVPGLSSPRAGPCGTVRSEVTFSGPWRGAGYFSCPWSQTSFWRMGSSISPFSSLNWAFRLETRKVMLLLAVSSFFPSS